MCARARVRASCVSACVRACIRMSESPHFNKCYDSNIADTPVNVAVGATCTASCQPEDNNLCKPCVNAIDGEKYTAGWLYKGAAVGGWLQIVFDKTYDVSSLYILLPYYQTERAFKDVKLTFSDRHEQTVSMS